MCPIVADSTEEFLIPVNLFHGGKLNKEKNFIARAAGYFVSSEEVASV